VVFDGNKRETIIANTAVRANAKVAVAMTRMSKHQRQSPFQY